MRGRGKKLIIRIEGFNSIIVWFSYSYFLIIACFYTNVTTCDKMAQIFDILMVF